MAQFRVLFDLAATQPSGENHFHGGGEYAKAVFYRLCEYIREDVNFAVEVFYNPKKPMEDSILETCKSNGFTINFCVNHEEISNLLCSKNYNAFYSALPYSYYDLTIPSHTKFVYTIHGLRLLEAPADKFMYKYNKNRFKTKIKILLSLLFPFVLHLRKKHVNKNYIDNLFSLFTKTDNQTLVSISNHTKYSISYFFPNIDISKIPVLYSPLKLYDIDDAKSTEILQSFSLVQDKYILLICGNRSGKGAYHACNVLYQLIKNNERFPQNIKIIVLGVSYLEPYQKLVKHNERFIFTGYVPTEHLEILYKNAFLFIYPTLNEGFGAPPLEAMKYGTISACSSNSALTEIYGDSVIYFNPFDEIEMGNRILMCFDEEIRKEKTLKINERFNYIREKQENDLNLLVRTILS